MSTRGRPTPLVPESPFIGYAGVGGVHADSALVFYADESGNSGANYLDDAQPCYIAAGWLLRQVDQDDARRAVRRCLRDTGMTELSGVQLVKTTRGRKAALSLVSTMMAFATPVVVVLEKRFALGAMIAQELIYPAARRTYTEKDRADCRAHSQLLSGLPDDVLRQASRFMRRPVADEASNFLPQLVEALTACGATDLAGLARTVAAAPPRFVPQLDSVRASGLAPNILGFTTLLQMLEVLGRQSDQTIDLTHDHADQFAHAYRFYQSFGANPVVMAAADDYFAAAGAPGLLTHVGEPRFCDSKTEPLVQAADLLAGIVNSLVKQLWRGDAWALDQLPLSLLTLGGFFNSDLAKFFMFVGSDKAGRLTGDAVVDAVQRVSRGP